MKQKSIVTFLCIFSMVLFITGTSFASPYYGSVILVEADPIGLALDGETNVTFTISDYPDSWTLGEWTGGGFQTFGGSMVTRSAGSVVDFAINNGSTTYRLSNGDGAVTFLNQNQGNVEAPTWVTVWYDDLYINWTALSLSTSISFVSTDGDPDGVAAVPIPATAWIFGAGLIGLVGIRRKLRT